MHRSDPDLIRACREGRQSAWNALIDQYGRLVYSIPRRYGLSDSDADDVFQSVFSILFQRLETLQDDTKLSAWLITTTHRECWRAGRKAGRNPMFEGRIADVGQPDPLHAEAWEQQHLVRRALDELGDPCRELLTALFLEKTNPNYEAIAARLNMKIGSIGPTRARCFRKLEPILRRLGVARIESADAGREE